MNESSGTLPAPKSAYSPWTPSNPTRPGTQCYDMHGASGGSAFCTDDASTIRMGGRALEKLISAIKGSPALREGNNAIFVVWDENDYGLPPNQVVTIVVRISACKALKVTRPTPTFRF
jgi:hypothetical protein